MSKSRSLFAAVAAVLAVLPAGAFAQCANQTRTVALDKGNNATLKSYLCTSGTGADAQQFRVEYYRLSDGAVSLLLANNSSVKLRKTLGPVKIISNEVSQTYASLVKQFGVTSDVPKNTFETGDLIFTVTPEDQATSPPPGDQANAADDREKIQDKTDLRKLRTLIALWGPPLGDDFPAVAEINALQKKTIPNNLNYYYSFLRATKGADSSDNNSSECDKQDITCRKLGDALYEMSFWRNLKIEDIDNFSANAKTYNAQLLKVRKNKTDAQSYFIGPDDPNSNYDHLLKFISGGELPDDFLFLVGERQYGADCGDSGDDLPGMAGWRFKPVRRDIKIDAIFVENLSKQPLPIAQFFGERNADTTLRVTASAPILPANALPLDGTSYKIAPGQTAIILTRILFQLPAGQLDDTSKYPHSMDALHSAFGSNDFAGNASAYHAPPTPKDYTFGPTLTVTGASINSARLDFAARPVPNFLRLAASQEGASCPYLLSWDDGDHEWISHGKILDKGQGRDRAYTETVVFPELRIRFRIEEREPEVAHLQDLTATIELRDGSTRALSLLKPSGETSLLWGEAADFIFKLPEAVKAADVVETRLQVSGYYERYSSLLAQRNELRQATPLPMRVNTAEPAATASPAR